MARAIATGRRFARTPGLVLVPVEQEPHGRRGRHHHHQRRRAAPSRAARFRTAAACAGGVWYEHHVISGNYRLGEFQGAVLNCQLDRLEEQTAHARRAMAAYLASRLARAARHLIRRARPAECTRHAITCSCCGSMPPRSARRVPPCSTALEAEGIPVLGRLRLLAARTSRCSATRRSARSCRGLRDRLDYSAPRCPNSDLICREQCVWLGQHLLLGIARGHRRHRPGLREGARAPRRGCGPSMIREQRCAARRLGARSIARTPICRRSAPGWSRSCR